MSGIDQEVLDRVLELQKEMQDCGMTIKQCAVLQRKVAELVNTLFQGLKQLDERMKAIEARHDQAGEYQQEQSKR